MRIIGGKYKGRIIKFPKGLAARPTTDVAKESLFNILCNRYTINENIVLDLFAGSGSISYEFISRGASEVICVDNQYKSIKFIKEQTNKFGLNIKAVKNDAFKFLDKCTIKFDIIFADPPYILENTKNIPEIVFSKKLLNKNGLLIIEHGRELNFDKSINFIEKRKYSSVNFSFFKENHENE